MFWHLHPLSLVHFPLVVVQCDASVVVVDVVSLVVVDVVSVSAVGVPRQIELYSVLRSAGLVFVLLPTEGVLNHKPPQALPCVQSGLPVK